MFKQGLALIAYGIFAMFILLKGIQLPLIFFVLFPALIFPLFYFYDRFHKINTAIAAAVTIVNFAIYFTQHPSYESMVVGLEYGIIIAALLHYRRSWAQALRLETIQSETVQNELTTLRKRYDSRLESLHHLEKQVSSLMELFEMARDFSEALSLEVMSDLLYKKLLPILPFRTMQLLVFKKVEHNTELVRRFRIDAKGSAEENAEMSAEEEEIFGNVLKSKKMLKTGDAPLKEGALATSEEQWIFPIILEGEVATLMHVQGANPEDLVKFEVLVAHLVLQMKKIRLYETVRELSIIDGLTGVYVRRHFLERFDEELKRSIKFQLPLAVLMLDIDHFKRYNDDFGHLVGDATLKEVAKMLRENLRRVDIVARYGGEEFVVIIPETQPQVAQEIAERIRSNIARHRFKVYDVETQVTVSIGISVFPDDIPETQRTAFYDDLAFDLIRHADKALYRAKEEGRNRVFNYRDL